MIQEQVSLKQYSNYKIGGLARYFVAVQSEEDVIASVQKARELDLPIIILGGGTNVLINDAVLNALVIRCEFSELQIDEGVRVRVGSGVSMKDLVQFCIDNSLEGMEWAGGLPGTVGGAVWGNAGAFKGEMKDSLISVVSIDITQDPKMINRTNAECQFGYRSSIFKVNAANGIKEIITEIIFELKKGSKELIEKIANEKINYRITKQPLEYPNIGSMFKNVPIEKVPEDVLRKFENKIKPDPFPVLPTAVLTDAAGLKGRTAGGAMISPKHPNFIINATGNATAADVKELMALIRSEIKKQFGVELEQEIIEI